VLSPIANIFGSCCLHLMCRLPSRVLVGFPRKATNSRPLASRLSSKSSTAMLWRSCLPRSRVSRVCQPATTFPLLEAVELSLCSVFCHAQSYKGNTLFLRAFSLTRRILCLELSRNDTWRLLVVLASFVLCFSSSNDVVLEEGKRGHFQCF